MVEGQTRFRYASEAMRHVTAFPGLCLSALCGWFVLACHSDAVRDTDSSLTADESLPQIPEDPRPTVATESFTPSGVLTDIADDVAIYANPDTPELSVVIADDKDTMTGGIAVFDMQGKQLQFRKDGMIGNVDLRTDFPLGSDSIVLVGANNRSDESLEFWQLDGPNQRLSAPLGEIPTTNDPNYGFCLYHSAISGKFYAFVTQETGKSRLEQYELSGSDGTLSAKLVRAFDVGSISEGCVADDELGRLYVCQEDVALWRYSAEPDGGEGRTAVATVGDGNVAADLEGVGLAQGPNATGYIVVSIQAEDRFAVYDRQTNAYLRGFTVGETDEIDAVNETDGLEISTSNLGPGFPRGVLVVHDGNNSLGKTSNLKFVPLE
jgi:3-phytase